jgi:hypothetical protein
MLTYNERERRGDPAKALGTVPIPGTKAGAIVSIGMVIICWFALPVSRPFILGTGGIGLIVGLLLYWRHQHRGF